VIALHVNVPMPLPSGVSLQWTETGAACVVWCGHCRLGVAIYSTVFKRNPDALAEAVEEHRECRARADVEALRLR